LVASCIGKAGFEYYPVPHTGSRVDEPHGGLMGTYELVVPVRDLDRDRVAKWGHGVDPKPAGEIEVFPNQEPEVGKTKALNSDCVEALSSSAEEAY
jgi:hypothetical protein